MQKGISILHFLCQTHEAQKLSFCLVSSNLALLLTVLKAQQSRANKQQPNLIWLLLNTMQYPLAEMLEVVCDMWATPVFRSGKTRGPEAATSCLINSSYAEGPSATGYVHNLPPKRDICADLEQMASSTCCIVAQKQLIV